MQQTLQHFKDQLKWLRKKIRENNSNRVFEKVDGAGKLLGGIGDSVEQVFKGAGEVVDKVVDGAGKIIDKAGDNISKVVDSVGKAGNKLLTTIMNAAAITTKE